MTPRPRRRSRRRGLVPPRRFIAHFHGNGLRSRSSAWCLMLSWKWKNQRRSSRGLASPDFYGDWSAGRLIFPLFFLLEGFDCAHTRRAHLLTSRQPSLCSTPRSAGAHWGPRGGQTKIIIGSSLSLVASSCIPHWICSLVAGGPSPPFSLPSSPPPLNRVIHDTSSKGSGATRESAIIRCEGEGGEENQRDVDSMSGY